MKKESMKYPRYLKKKSNNFILLELLIALIIISAAIPFLYKTLFYCISSHTNLKESDELIIKHDQAIQLAKKYVIIKKELFLEKLMQNGVVTFSIDQNMGVLLNQSVVNKKFMLELERRKKTSHRKERILVKMHMLNGSLKTENKIDHYFFLDSDNKSAKKVQNK